MFSLLDDFDFDSDDSVSFVDFLRNKLEIIDVLLIVSFFVRHLSWLVDDRLVDANLVLLILLQQLVPRVFGDKMIKQVRVLVQETMTLHFVLLFEMVVLVELIRLLWILVVVVVTVLLLLMMGIRVGPLVHKRDSYAFHVSNQRTVFVK